jgi:pimeloyl-[acyl-carrier protein] synthase
MLGRWMPWLDGDRHRRMRKAFGGMFTASRAERYRQLIAARAARLVEQAEPHGGMDLVRDFARPLPFAVIADVLGIPKADRARVGAAIGDLNRGLGRPTDHSALDAANAAAVLLTAYFSELLDQRATEPADDLMSALAVLRPEAGERADVLANCVYFVSAGHQTTAALLTLGAYLLCAHPQARAALLSDPARWPGAVEELLRLVSPVTVISVAARGPADLDGLHACAGQQVALFLTAANRDPDVFAEPDVLDIGRDPNPQLSFSAGAHYCLGAPLARLHGEEGLRTLFSMLPGLAAASPPDVTASVPVRQVEHFAVRWPRD